MTSPPDKIFRDGLEHYSKPAPASAWSRIESRIDHKRNRTPWLKIAAGHLLVVATSVLLWQQNQRVSSSQLAIGKEQESMSERSGDPAIGLTMRRESKEQIADSNREASIVKREASDVIREAQDLRRQSSVVSREASVDVDPSEEKLQQPAAVVAVANKKSPDSNLTSHDSRLTSENTDEIITEPAPLAQVEATKEISGQVATVEPDRANITYSSEQVNAKFLKQTQTPDATPEKKNTSGLQKVIDRALDLKYEESVLADLREKKNEWLSLNIPSRQRETNK